MKIHDMPLSEDEVERCFKKKRHKRRKSTQHEVEETPKFESTIGSRENPRIALSPKVKAFKVKQFENDAKYADQMPVTNSKQHIFFRDSDFDSYQSYQKDSCSTSWAVSDEVKKDFQPKKPKHKHRQTNDVQSDALHDDTIDITNFSRLLSSKETSLHLETIGSAEEQKKIFFQSNTARGGDNLNLNDHDASMVPDELQLLDLGSNELRKASKTLEHSIGKDPYHLCKTNKIRPVSHQDYVSRPLLPSKVEKTLKKKKHRLENGSCINYDVETQGLEIGCEQMPRKKSSNKESSLSSKSSVNINGKCEEVDGFISRGISRDDCMNSMKLPMNLFEKSSASNKIVRVFQAVDLLNGESASHCMVLNSELRNVSEDAGILLSHPQDHGDFKMAKNVENIVAKKKRKQKKKDKLSYESEVLNGAGSSLDIVSEDQSFDTFQQQINLDKNLHPKKRKQRREYREVRSLESLQFISCNQECESSQTSDGLFRCVEEKMEPCNLVVNELGQPFKKRKRKREKINGKSNSADMAQIINTRECLAGLDAATDISVCLKKVKTVSSFALTSSMEKSKNLHGGQHDSISICQAGNSKQNHNELDEDNENCSSRGGQNKFASVLSDTMEESPVMKKHKRRRENSQSDAIETQRCGSDSTKASQALLDTEMLKVVRANGKVPVQSESEKDLEVLIDAVKGKVRSNHSFVEQVLSPDPLQFGEVKSGKQFKAADSIDSVKKEEASGGRLPSSEHSGKVRGIESKPLASPGFVLIEDSDGSDDSLEVISFDTSSDRKIAPDCDHTLGPPAVNQSADVQMETLSPQVVQSRIVVSKILPNKDRWAKRQHLLPKQKGRVRPAKLLLGRPPDGRHEVFLKARTIKELEDAGVKYTTGAWRERELRQLHENIVWYCDFFGVSLDQMLDTNIQPKGRQVYLPLSYKIFRRPWEIWEKFSKSYNPQPEKAGQAFSVQDVSDLLHLRGKYGKNWVHIGQKMGRHRLSVVKKYSRLEDCGLTENGEQGIVKPPRNPFTAEEDKLIVQAVKSMAADESGNIDKRKISWRLVARFVGGRTASDCERRWKYRIMAPGRKSQRDLETSHDVVMQKVARYLLSAPVEDFADINWQDVVSACGVAVAPYLLRKQFLKFFRYRIKDFSTKSGTEVLQLIKEHWGRMFKRKDIVIL